MTQRTVVLSPRAVPSGVVRVPLQAPNYRPAAVISVFGALAAFAAFVAVAAEEPAFRVMMGSLALLLGLGGPAIVRWQESISEGHVRIDASSHELRFVASAGTFLLLPTLAVMGVVPAAALLAFSLSGLPAAAGAGVGRWTPYLLGVISLGWLGQQLFALRTPRGLALTPSGLTGVRGSARVSLPWSELKSARPSTGRGAKLVLGSAPGALILIEPRWMGSDPNEVAAIIAHFIHRPEDRALLTDPRAALSRVAEVAAGG